MLGALIVMGCAFLEVYLGRPAADKSKEKAN
jgi:hypothetical protein